ncbi:MAG: hypothetical protein IJO63_01070 [Bacilli bacterium]|nr:hypothetical protein [Bacilli bacterium]
MSKRKKKKGLIALLCIMIVACVVIYLIIANIGKSSSKVVDEIASYGYTLDNRDTELMQDVFNKLKKELNEEDVNYEKYAEYLSELFIIDLYTLDNKLNKYDVGGAEYIYPDHKANFKLKVGDTLYRYLEDESDRKQKLPEVSEITVNEIEETTFKYQENEYEAYNIVVDWKYKNDLGYDTSAKVVLFKVEDKLFIAEFTPEVSE